MEAILQEFVLRLPQDVVEMLQRAASQRHKTPDEIAAEALRLSLQPLRQEALQHLEDRIRRQSALSETQQRAYLEAQLTGEEQQLLSLLLSRNREEGLNANEQAELQALFDRIEGVATNKAAAIWLLSGKAANTDAT